MIEKKHTAYGRRLKTVSIGCFAAMVSILLVASSRAISTLLPDAVWFLTYAGLCFGTLFYYLWSKRHLRCPDCSSECAGYPDGTDWELRVFCEGCNTIWKLGVYRDNAPD